MGEQGASTGGALSTNGLIDIAASRAIHWNVDLDRGLRSSKPGAHYEAILKTGLRMLWWSQEPVASATTAALFKLEAGQDRTFSNAVVQRLAEAFRTGNNFTRLCVLKVFLLASRGQRRNGPAREGLLRKERVANHPEVLRKVKVVLDSGDAIARALALRMIGCLAEFAVDSVDVHRLVVDALQSPHHKEVEAAFYAMGRLCDLSVDFAGTAFNKVVEMVNAMETPPDVKKWAICVFAKLGRSSALALRVQEAGKEAMLRLPTTDVVSTMLIALTGLAAEAIVTTSSQVELLLAYLSSDLRATVRAVALQCLSKLARQAARSTALGGRDFAVLLSVVEDGGAPPALHVLAFQVLTKLSCHYVIILSRDQLQKLVSLVELSVLHHEWSVAQAALSCLVETASNITRLRKPRRNETESEEERQGAGMAAVKIENTKEVFDGGLGDSTVTQIDLAVRVGVLLCDQLAIAGSVAKGCTEGRGMGPMKGDLKLWQEIEAETNTVVLEKVTSLCELVAQLVHGCPHASLMMIDSIASMIETFTEEHLQGTMGQRDVQQSVKEISQMDADSKAGMKSGPGESLNEGSEMESQELPIQVKVDDETKVEFVLALCHCICVCVRDLAADAGDVEGIYQRLHYLATDVVKLDPSCEILRAILPALMRAGAIHRDMSERSEQCYSPLDLVAPPPFAVSNRHVNILVQQVAHQLRERGNFWSAYTVGVKAAEHGLWEAAHSAFEFLAKKVQSDGCYFWLEGLSQLAGAEALLASLNTKETHMDEHGGTAINRERNAGKAGLTERPISLELSGNTSSSAMAWLSGPTAMELDDRSVSRGPADLLGKQEESLGREDSIAHATKVGDCQHGMQGCSVLGKFGEAAAKAIPLLQGAASKLAAGVCLGRTFEFQRWLLSIRLRILECVVGLSRVMESISMDFVALDSGNPGTGPWNARASNFGTMDGEFSKGTSSGAGKLSRGFSAGVGASNIGSVDKGRIDINLGVEEVWVPNMGRSSAGMSDTGTSNIGGLDAMTVNVDEIYRRQAESTFKAVAEKASALASQMGSLTRELDLLCMCFMGINRESLCSLTGAALSSSLLAFCILFFFSFVDVNRDSRPQLGVRSAAGNLDRRLRRFNGLEYSELSLFCIEQGMDGTINSEVGFGGASGPPHKAVSRLCQRAIKSVFQLRRDAAGMLKKGSVWELRVKGVQLLQDVLGEWLRLPSPIPGFFFCTRPRIGVELFVTQTGGEELGELSVTQGSALLVNVCLQVSYPPSGNFPKARTLFCVLSYRAVDNTSVLEEDMYAGWKVGWHEGQALNPSLSLNLSLLQKLVLRAKLAGSPEAVKIEQDLVQRGGTEGNGRREPFGGDAGRSINQRQASIHGWGLATPPVGLPTEEACGSQGFAKRGRFALIDHLESGKGEDISLQAGRSFFPLQWMRRAKDLPPVCWMLPIFHVAYVTSLSTVFVLTREADNGYSSHLMSTSQSK